MFDDHNNGQQPGVPNNLPVKEPEDMFGATEPMQSGIETPSQPVVPAPSVEPTQVSPQPRPAVEPIQTVQEVASANPSSALGAGALRPKNSPQDTPQSSPVQQPTPLGGLDSVPGPREAGVPQDMYKIKEPSIGHGILITVIVLVVVSVLGFGGWWIYSFVVAPQETGGDFISTDDTVPSSDTVQDSVVNTVPSNTTTDTATPDISGEIIDEQVLFGEPVDADADGLDDAREVDLGTNPKNWDSDGDELSDGDEVIVWKTDPLNPDTDGDTYLDGLEVKSGYDPDGPGRLFEPPTNAMTNTSS